MSFRNKLKQQNYELEQQIRDKSRQIVQEVKEKLNIPVDIMDNPHLTENLSENLPSVPKKSTKKVDGYKAKYDPLMLNGLFSVVQAVYKQYRNKYDFLDEAINLPPIVRDIKIVMDFVYSEMNLGEPPYKTDKKKVKIDAQEKHP